MPILFLIVVLLGLSAVAFQVGRGRALRLAGDSPRKLHSLPGYYGYYVALWCILPAALVLAVWVSAQPYVQRYVLVSSLGERVQAMSPEAVNLMVTNVRNLAGSGTLATTSDPLLREAAERYASLRQTSTAALWVVVLGVAVAGTTAGWRFVSPRLRAINKVETAVKAILLAASTVAILTTLGIVLSLLFEALRFFQRYPVTDFLFGIQWSPQTALREDQVGSSGSFGAVPLFAGTLLISGIAMTVAVPVGLLSAIYLSEYASHRFRTVVKPLLEILAGIPTVVYGFFAALTVAPLIRNLGESIGLTVSSESALAAGLVMGVMIIPFVSSISNDVINAVPQALREASYGVGATKSETIKKVVFPAALPGIVGGILLAISRAIGETMIVVMAAGLSANLTANPLQAVTTVTVQIVSLLVGDQEFDSAKTLSAFALGLVLFAVTLVFNIIALKVVRKYREQYE
jgi:phosphate transport system permease protein